MSGKKSGLFLFFVDHKGEAFAVRLARDGNVWSVVRGLGELFPYVGLCQANSKQEVLAGLERVSVFRAPELAEREVSVHRN